MIGGVELAAIIAVVTFVFGVGVYVGRNEATRELSIVAERLRSHEGILVHKGAVPRSQYEPEIGGVRDKIRDLQDRVHAIEEHRRRGA